MKQAIQFLQIKKMKQKEKGKSSKNSKISPTEPEAAIQPMKNEVLAPSYKPSILVSSNRIILAKGIDPTNEQKIIKKLLEQTEKMTGTPVERLLLDAGYFCEEIISLAVEKEIDLLCPKHNNSKKEKHLKVNFKYNKEANEYTCPNNKTLKYKETYYNKTQGKTCNRYRADPKDCNQCEFKKICTTNKKGKQITQYEIDETKDILIEIMKNEEAKKIYKTRAGSVEPVFSEIKGVQGLRRFSRRGIEGAELEFSLHAICHNIRHLLLFRRHSL